MPLERNIQPYTSRGMANAWFIVLGSCLLFSTLSCGEFTSTGALRRLARRVCCFQDALKPSFGSERNLDRDTRDKEYKSKLDRCRREFLLFERQKRFSFMWPETKWCGPGNVADNYTDLGPEREADKCCRTHDHCPDTIRRFSYDRKYKLWNTYFSTVSSCACDAAFNKCLHNVNNAATTGIGEMFFNKLNVPCFKEKSPGSEMAFFTTGKYEAPTTPTSISPNTTPTSVSPNANSALKNPDSTKPISP
ncbi:acidic phospholipase A2 PA4-like isoform X2 [Lineus longissimus]|uniref:acidic phospholipase A2 PA4-like isoform X2 n=1 Tax=Lineus longissimus TaxID=88925 RepID=UPI00315CED29